jgi:type I restriction enzyme M protein
MDDERSELIGEPSLLPKDCRWRAIKDLQGQTLADAYGKVLDKLSRQDGLIGTIFLTMASISGRGVKYWPSS